MFDDKSPMERSTTVDSFVDADGLTWVRPVAPTRYEDGAAPWLRGLLVLVVLALGWLFLRVNDRASQDPHDSFPAVWLKYSDIWITRMEFNLDARTEVLAGDSSKVKAMFTFYAFEEQGSLPAEMQDLVVALPQPTPAESIRQEAQIAAYFESPHAAEMVQTCVDWDLSLLAFVSDDGTEVTNPAGLAAVDGDAVLDELRAEHERARPLYQADFDALRRGQRIASIARWVILSLAVGCVVLAVWIRRRALGRAERDLEAYRAANTLYWRQRRLTRMASARSATCSATDDTGDSQPLFTAPM